jgi:hypothetical protein
MSARRAQKLFRMSSILLPNTLPSVVHVAATCETRKTKCSTTISNNDINNSNIHLHTLNTSQMKYLPKEVTTADDFFLLCFFRAVSSHVLTTGSNLRAESDLVISSLTNDLLTLRTDWGFSNTAPIPVVLTRLAQGIDFNAPFFQERYANGLEPPILLVPKAHEDEVRAKCKPYMKGTKEVATVISFISQDTRIEDPSCALKALFEIKGVDRVSVECGPSVTSLLYETQSIDALSISTLRSYNANAGATIPPIPMIAYDPTFSGKRQWASSFEPVSGQHSTRMNEDTGTYYWTYDLYFCQQRSTVNSDSDNYIHVKNKKK